MYIVVLFTDGKPCGGTTKEGHRFMFAFPCETYKKAKQYGESISEILAFEYKIFTETEKEP